MSKKNLIIFIFTLAIVFNFIRSIQLFDLKKITDNVFNLKYYENRYNQSQWVIPNSKKPIGDDIVYTYAGAKYILGTNPILINSEHPPLGKNLIGLSALLLKNEYYFSLFSGIFALISFYLLSQTILKNRLISFLLTIFLGLEPLFVANYFLTLLDLLIFGLINLYFYFLIKYSEGKNYLNVLINGFIIGLIISIKFYGLSIPLILSTLIFFLLKKDYKGMIVYVLSLSISLFTLIVNYFQFFIKGNNLISFLKLQKYIYVFHTQGRKDFTFLNSSLLLLFFKGKFYLSINKLGQEYHYSLFWILSFLTSLFFIIKSFLEKSVKNKKIFLLIIWVIIYSLFQSITLTNARYLIILLPYLYLIPINFLLNKDK